MSDTTITAACASILLPIITIATIINTIPSTIAIIITCANTIATLTIGGSIPGLSFGLGLGDETWGTDFALLPETQDLQGTG